MVCTSDVFGDVLTTIEKNTKNPEKFLSVQSDVALKFRNRLKDIYDFSHAEFERKSSALPELVVDGFDDEQIWQQLEIKNQSEITHLLGALSRVLSGEKKLELPVSVTEPEEKNSSVEQDNFDDDDDDESDDDDDDEYFDPNNKKKNDKQDENSEIDFSDDDDDDMLELDDLNDLGGKKNKQSEPQNFKSSVVDDEFFKLNELDKFLTQEDNKEFNQHKNEDSDHESIDLFEDGEESEGEGNARMIKYSEFFDGPKPPKDDKPFKNIDNTFPSDMEDEDDEEEIGNKRKASEPAPSTKRVKFDLLKDSDEDDDEAENGENDSSGKSTFESRQERLQKKIAKLEQVAISEKPWQLKGEVSARNRPENSLLEEFVEVETTARPEPIIEEWSMEVEEDIVRRVISDRTWNSVTKKFKPVETPTEYKKKLVMDQEKSQKSLAQIYEDEYVKQKGALKPDDQEREEEEPKEHIEIRELMHALFAKLDALSNFHYTPRQAQPEIKIIRNIPAINMEEVAPVATTNATLLAPEEVTNKPRGDVIGKSERTKTDMKRARRKKKVFQKEKQKATEKKEQMMKDVPYKNRKQAKIAQVAMVKKLTKDRNITTVSESNKAAPKSSTAFFQQLQDQVASQLKTSKKTSTKKKKDKNQFSATKLKL